MASVEALPQPCRLCECSRSYLSFSCFRLSQELSASRRAGLLPGVPVSVFAWPASSGHDLGEAQVFLFGLVWAGGQAWWGSAPSSSRAGFRCHKATGKWQLHGNLRVKLGGMMPLFGENVKCQVVDNEQ